MIGSLLGSPSSWKSLSLPLRLEGVDVELLAVREGLPWLEDAATSDGGSGQEFPKL